MQAFLIDPYTQTVTEVQTSGKLRDGEDGVYGLLSGSAKAVDCVTVINLNDDQDTLYLDDDGFLGPGVPVFGWSGFHAPLAGKALVLGCNDEGDATAPKSITLADVQKRVIWTVAESTGEFESGRYLTPAELKAYNAKLAGLKLDFGYGAGAPVLQRQGSYAASKAPKTEA